MKPVTFQGFLEQIQDDCNVKNKIYDPLVMIQCQKYAKQGGRTPNTNAIRRKITYDLLQSTQNKKTDIKQAQNTVLRDQNIDKILMKKNEQIKQQNQQPQQKKKQQYQFNKFEQTSFKQTPVYRCILQTPIHVFYKKYEHKIQQLIGRQNNQQKFQAIPQNSDPQQFKQKPSAFFVGIALHYQSLDFIIQPLYMYNLACYIEPLNSRVWEEFIQFTKRIGMWRKACILAKTAFLLCPNSFFAEEYLLCGDKAQFPIYELRGLLSSLKHPQKYQKVIIQSARYQIKNRKIWRGMSLLYNYCLQSNYKSTSASGVLLLIKCLELTENSQHVFRILENSIQKSNIKFQIFSTYIQLKLRLNNGILYQDDIKFLERSTQNLANEIKYRLPLLIAEILVKTNNMNFYYFIQNSYKLICRYNKGVSKQRAIKQIYNSIINSLGLYPNLNLLHSQNCDEYLVFLANKVRYVKGQPLLIHKFKNWKYYLHYALIHQYEMLYEAYQQFNQGRLIAQAIHILRNSRNPIVLLNFWRAKINVIPKSGQLWCEGGRIYLQLGQLQNAIKCFKFAIHLTPQYGDSFIQLLKIYLIQNNFLAINQLKKSFIISEPFYGNVLNFLQMSHQNFRLYKLSLGYIWNNAYLLICNQLYKGKIKQNSFLTAIPGYNMGFKNPNNEIIRQILFSSYEQMQNKNAKT